MDLPPSRYKVVEQGRRLVVIDTWNGNAPVTGHQPVPGEAARPATVEQARAALRPARRQPATAGADAPETVITTQPWFDSKGPRRVMLDGSSLGMLLVLLLVAGMAAALILLMWGWPALLVLGFILAQKQARAGLRAGATAWLDTQQSG